jgi:ADP-ribose pyrophosphatase YjhB (NUDIX family)
VTAVGDISWRAPGGRFNLRAAAMITRGDEILLCQVDPLGCWFLPGGRVRLGEPSDAALARELTEELGRELPAGRLALIVENIFTGETLEHELGVYYQLTWPDALADDDLASGTEPGHWFRWVPLSELRSVWFEPAGLVPFLQDLGDGLRHVVLERPA